MTSLQISVLQARWPHNTAAMFWRTWSISSNTWSTVWGLMWISLTVTHAFTHPQPPTITTHFTDNTHHSLPHSLNQGPIPSNSNKTTPYIFNRNLPHPHKSTPQNCIDLNPNISSPSNHRGSSHPHTPSTHSSNHQLSATTHSPAQFSTQFPAQISSQFPAKFATQFPAHFLDSPLIPHQPPSPPPLAEWEGRGKERRHEEQLHETRVKGGKEEKAKGRKERGEAIAKEGERTKGGRVKNRLYTEGEWQARNEREDSEHRRRIKWKGETEKEDSEQRSEIKWKRRTAETTRDKIVAKNAKRYGQIKRLSPSTSPFLHPPPPTSTPSISASMSGWWVTPPPPPSSTTTQPQFREHVQTSATQLQPFKLLLSPFRSQLPQSVTHLPQSGTQLSPFSIQVPQSVTHLPQSRKILPPATTTKQPTFRGQLPQSLHQQPTSTTQQQVLRTQLPPSPPQLPQSQAYQYHLKTRLPLSTNQLPKFITSQPQFTASLPKSTVELPFPNRQPTFSTKQLLPQLGQTLPPSTTSHPVFINQLSPSTHIPPSTLHLPKLHNHLPQSVTHQPTFLNHLPPSARLPPSTTHLPPSQLPQSPRTITHLPLSLNQLSPSTSIPPTTIWQPQSTSFQRHSFLLASTNIHQSHARNNYRNLPPNYQNLSNNYHHLPHNYHNRRVSTASTTTQPVPTTISEDPAVLQPPPQDLAYHNYHNHYRHHSRRSQQRQPKWLSLTGLLRGVFGRRAAGGGGGGRCVDEGGREGVCILPGRCVTGGGTPSTPCTQGYATCCLAVTNACQATATANNTYWIGEGGINGVVGRTCTLTIHKLSPDICALRIDFLRLQLAPPVLGQCMKDILAVTGQNLNSVVPRICGNNTGHHMYVGVDSVVGPVTLSLTTIGGGINRTWDIGISQIECGSPLRPPSNCLQYFTAGQGSFSSFNYNPVNASAYMNKLNYAVCVRKDINSCSIVYTNNDNPSDNPKAFDIANFRTDSNGVLTPVVQEGESGVGLVQCPGDYLVMAGTRLCGQRLNDGSREPQPTNNGPVTDNTNGPFIVQFISDDQYVGRGFLLNYQQLPC